jgi:hypothetical protein
MKRFSVILVVFTCIFFSCKKEYSLQKFSIDGSVTDISYSEKTFSVNNHADLLLKTPTGLKIHIPAYAFVNSLGQPVSDNIIIEVKEYLKPDAMILHNKPSVSGGRPLESGGEFFIGAIRGTDKLKLAPGIFIQLDLPKIGVDLKGMKVFNGIPTASSTANIDWVLNNNSGNVVAPIDSSALTPYALFSDNIDWINCDRYPIEQVVDYDIYTGNSPDPNKTFAYIHFTGRNSVMTSYKVGTQSLLRAGVLELEATIVGLCIKDNERYVSIMPATLRRGGSTTLDRFVKMTEDELKQKLKTLRYK